jgi:hypothetical protein
MSGNPGRRASPILPWSAGSRPTTRWSALGAVLAVAGVTACADNESSLYVRHVQVPNDECIVEPDPESLFRTSGVLDAAVRFEYNATLLIGNQVVGRGDTDQLRTETSKIRIYEYDVRILNAEGAVLSGAEYTAPTAGFIDQKEGETEAYGLAGAILVDANTSSALANSNVVQEVVSEVVVRGRTLGGNELETAPFAFPISVCNGCTVFFPKGVTENGLACAGEGEEEIEPLCNPGQDSPTDCRLCRNSAPDVCNFAIP